MNGPLLRLLDANANRAREALRVLEDYARFVLNDDALSADLKHLRHSLQGAIAPFLPQAILFRDADGDVGRAIKTADEQSRLDLSHVVIAAGKRLGEALRSLEEYLKTLSQPAAAEVEGMRYQFYVIEQRIARTLKPDNAFANVRLYVLVTASLCRGSPWMAIAEAALAGGADCIQLREKELEGGELLLRARQLVALCRRYGRLCIVNDRVDVAILSDADGVHLGQGDLPAVDARRLMGRHKIVGVSTHGIGQAKQAVLDGADYIGVGPVFPSRTKPRDILPGVAYARQAADEIPIPSVAIAGITLDNVDEVAATGVGAVAVSSAIVSCDNPAAAAAAFQTRLTAPRLTRRARGARPAPV